MAGLLLLPACSMKSLLYPAPPIAVGPPPPGFEEVVLGDGSEAGSVAWAHTAAEPSAPAVVFFHGNGENLETLRQAGTLDRLHALGVHALVVDYPGYGRSGGSPSEEANIAAGAAAAAELARRHPDSRVYLVGWSLGAAVAAQVASASAAAPGSADPDASGGDGFAGLALLSPWTTLHEIASRHYPAWMVGMLLRETYDTRSALASALTANPLPVLVVHGTDDRIIPAELGRDLAASVRELGSRSGSDSDPGWGSNLAEYLEVVGAGHNDLLGRDVVWERLREFLRG